jgi:hypothetical protein
VNFFDKRLERESRALRLVRWTIIGAAALHFSLALVSGYRAWVQVTSLRIETSDETLGPGSSISVEAVTSGRNPVTISLNAIQGGTFRTLASVTVPENHNRFYDPRTQRQRFVIVMTPDLLGTLEEGPVLLQARGLGRSQFLRVPPPMIVQREAAISRTQAVPLDVAQSDDTMCIAAKIGFPCG